MVSRVLYRPFFDEDFEACAEILRHTWHMNAASDEYNRLEAASDLAYSLSTSTFSQVALIDGEVMGIVLARSAQADPAWSQRWSDVDAQIIARMREVDPQAAEAHLGYVRREVRVNNRLLEESGIAGADQVTLLAVHADARGLGVGSVLLDAAVSYASARGASQLYLYTDSDCTWQFYERHGLRRAAMHRATGEERKLLPAEMYLYGLTLTA